jgi:hypothetical protein
MKLKRTIAALAFALVAAPVLAADIGAPYEATVADMALPNVKDPVITQSDSKPTLLGKPVGLPYEYTRAQMKLPDVKVWANDANFIAPPQ